MLERLCRYAGRIACVVPHPLAREARDEVERWGDTRRRSSGGSCARCEAPLTGREMLPGGRYVSKAQPSELMEKLGACDGAPNAQSSLDERCQRLMDPVD